MVGSGVDGSTTHGTQALDCETLVKRAGFDAGKGHPGGTTINAKSWVGRTRWSIDKECRPDCGVRATLADITELQQVMFVKGGKVVVRLGVKVH